MISRLLNVIYPSRCPVCSASSDEWSHAPICSSCWALIKQYTGPACTVCAMPVFSEHAGMCGQCMQKTPPFSKIFSFGLYEGVLAEAIHQLKFCGVRRLSKPLGEFLLCLDTPNADGVVPVPLTKKGLIKRGFNQSLLLAHVVAKRKGIALFMDSLVKIKETPPQVGLSAKERLTNLRNSLKVSGGLRDLSLLLVDDVITTGATVRECAHMLMKAGAKEVNVVSLARAPLL